jgi:hypothetical protein
MPYLLGWFANYFSLAIWTLGLPRWVAFLPTLLFCTAIISIRYSGTDTYGIYELTLDALKEGWKSDLITGWEPGFLLISKLLLSITDSPVLALRFIGIFFVGLLFAFFSRADRNELLYLSLWFFPVLVYQYGMNAVRAGLAMAVLLLAWQASRRGNHRAFLLWGLAALLFHYSALLPFLLLFLSGLSVSRVRTLILLVIALAFAAVLVASRQEYFLAKIALYSDYESPFSFSGLSRLILVTLVWMGVVLSPLGVGPKVRATALFLLPTLLFQGLAFFSYAGLRLLELMSFVAPLMAISEFDRARRPPGRTFWLILGIGGLLGAGFVYRNFLTDYDGQLTGTLTPFLPYRTIFDYRP